MNLLYPIIINKPFPEFLFSYHKKRVYDVCLPENDVLQVENKFVNIGKNCCQNKNVKYGLTLLVFSSRKLFPALDCNTKS